MKRSHLIGFVYWNLLEPFVRDVGKHEVCVVCRKSALLSLPISLRPLSLCTLWKYMIIDHSGYYLLWLS